jgi:hypothetical protein
MRFDSLVKLIATMFSLVDLDDDREDQGSHELTLHLPNAQWHTVFTLTGTVSH